MDNRMYRPLILLDIQQQISIKCPTTLRYHPETMIPKFLAIPKSTPSFFRGKKPAVTAAPGVRDANADAGLGLSSVLKIIHVGGIAEFHYMAVPAVSIMKKYPSFLLARPEVFRRPWDSLVHPEEILMPGERYFVVPQGTVRKLQRRIPRTTSILHHVSIESLSSWQSSSSSSSSASKSGDQNDKSISSTVHTSSRSRKKRSRKAVKWDPKLTIIHEGSSSQTLATVI